MSPFFNPFAKLRAFRFSRLRRRKNAPRRRPGCDERGFRRLLLDSLEERCMLDLNPLTLIDTAVTQHNNAAQVTTPGRSVASDPAGDFVVAWTRYSNVDKNGDLITSAAQGSPVSATVDGVAGQYLAANVFARYFTNQEEQVSLPTGVTKFDLTFGANTPTIEKLTVAGGTAPDGGGTGPMGTPLDPGSFTIQFQQSPTIAPSTASVSGWVETQPATNAILLQKALVSMASAQPDLTGVTVTVQNDDNYFINFAQNPGQTEPLVTLAGGPDWANGGTGDPATQNSSLSFPPAFLPTVLSSYAQTPTTVAVQLDTSTSPTAAVDSAQLIQSAINNATIGTVYTSPQTPSSTAYSPNVAGSGPGAPVNDITVPTTNLYSMSQVDVSVAAIDNSHFDITFVGATAYADLSYTNPVTGAVLPAFGVSDTSNDTFTSTGTVVTAAPGMAISGANVVILKKDSNEFRVNAAEPVNPYIITGSNVVEWTQKAPAVAMANDGNFVVTWQGYVNPAVTPNSSYDIFAREFQPESWINGLDTYTEYQNLENNGSFPAADLPLVTSNNTTNPALTADWTVINGVRPLTSQFRVNQYTDGAQFEPSVAFDQNDNFVIAYASESIDDSYFNGIMAQMYNTAADPVGGAIHVNDVDSNEHREPYVAMAPDGTFVVTWQLSVRYATVLTSNIPYIMARLYAPSGTPLGDEFQVFQEPLTDTYDTAAGWPTATFDWSTPSLQSTANNTYQFAVSWTTNEDQDLNLPAGTKTEGVYNAEYAMSLTGNSATPSTVTVLQNEIRANSPTLNSTSLIPPTSQTIWPGVQIAGQVVMDANGDITSTYTGYVPGLSAATSYQLKQTATATPAVGPDVSLAVAAKIGTVTTGEAGVGEATSISSAYFTRYEDAANGWTQWLSPNGPNADLLPFFPNQTIPAAFLTANLSERDGGAALTPDAGVIFLLAGGNPQYEIETVDMWALNHGATTEQAGRLRQILEDVAGTLNGNNGGVYFTQWDANPTLGTTNIISGDNSINSTRVGNDESAYIALASDTIGGNFTLNVNSPYGDTNVTIPVVENTAGDGLNATATAGNIQKVLASMLEVGGTAATTVLSAAPSVAVRVVNTNPESPFNELAIRDTAYVGSGAETIELDINWISGNYFDLWISSGDPLLVNPATGQSPVQIYNPNDAHGDWQYDQLDANGTYLQNILTIGTVGSTNGPTLSSIIGAVSVAPLAASADPQYQPAQIALAAGDTASGFSGDGEAATTTGADLNAAQGVVVDPQTGNIYIADTADDTIREEYGPNTFFTNGGVPVTPYTIVTIAGTAHAAGYIGDGGPASAALFRSPAGLALDANGDLYIADSGNNVIREIMLSTLTTNAPGSATIITVAGSSGAPGHYLPVPNVGDGGPATAGKLNDPQAVSVDGSGNIWIADTGDNAVREVQVAGAGTNPPDIITLAEGSGGSKISNTSQGVAVDANGNVYFADTGNNVVREVNIATGIISTVAGDGTGGYIGEGTAAAVELNHPVGVAIDPANGNLLIADTGNNRIREVFLSGSLAGTIITVAGSGGANYTGDGSVATASNVTLNQPQGVTADGNGDLFIADTGNSVIREVNASTGIITTVRQSAQMTEPYDVAVDSSGDVFIADTGNNVIREVTAGVISTYAGNGIQGYSAEGVARTAAEFSGPTGLAVDGSGNLYIADSGNNVIREVTKVTGKVTTFAGVNPGSGAAAPAGYFGEGVTANPTGTNAPTMVQLSSPQGLAVDIYGDVFIADTGNSVIREVSGGQIFTVAGHLPLTGPNPTYGDGLLATNARLNSPAGVAVDNAGDLFIADTNDNVIREVYASTGLINTVVGVSGAPQPAGFSANGTAAGLAQLTAPEGVATNAAGTVIYFSDTVDSVVRVMSGGNVYTVAGIYNTPGDTGDGGSPTLATMFGPNGIAVDKFGNLYIADTGGNSVRYVSGGNMHTLAGITVAGNYPLPGSSVPALGLSVLTPDGVAWDSSLGAYGGLVIADTGDNRLVEVQATVSGLTGTISIVTSAKFSSPTTVAVDSAGDLFVANPGTGASTIVEVAAGGAITTVAGTGVAGFNGENIPAIGAELNKAFGVAVDGSGDLFITDTGNDLIREVNASTGVVGSTADIVAIAGTQGVPGYSGNGASALALAVSVPAGIFTTAGGIVYVADTGDNRVWDYNSSTGQFAVVAGPSSSPYTAGNGGDGTAATLATLTHPAGVAVDASGNVYIFDTGNFRIREVVAATGDIVAFAGNGVAGYSGDGLSPTGPTAELRGAAPATLVPFLPRGDELAIDPSTGNLDVADTGNNVIRQVTSPTAPPQTQMIITIAGTGVAGFSGEDWPAAPVKLDLINPVGATSAALTVAGGVAIDVSGDIFFSDTYNNRIREVNPTTHIITTIAGCATQGSAIDVSGMATLSELNDPTGLALDGAGDLYISDSGNNRICMLDIATDVLSTVVTGTTVAGSTAAPVAFNDPTGLAMDGGSLLIADTLNNRICQWTVGSAANTATVIAGTGVFGSPGSVPAGSVIVPVPSGDGGPATAATLSHPEGVAVNANGTIYIADTDHYIYTGTSTAPVLTVDGLIREIQPNGTNPPVISTFASGLNYPTDVVVDSGKNIVYVSNTGNDTIIEIDSAGYVTTLAGTSGVAGFAGNGGSVTTSLLHFPTALGFLPTASGNVLVFVDAGNDCVRKITEPMDYPPVYARLVYAVTFTGDPGIGFHLDMVPGVSHTTANTYLPAGALQPINATMTDITPGVGEVPYGLANLTPLGGVQYSSVNPWDPNLTTYAEIDTDQMQYISSGDYVFEVEWQGIVHNAPMQTLVTASTLDRPSIPEVQAVQIDWIGGDYFQILINSKVVPGPAGGGTGNDWAYEDLNASGSDFAAILSQGVSWLEGTGTTNAVTAVPNPAIPDIVNPLWSQFQPNPLWPPEYLTYNYIVTYVGWPGLNFTLGEQAGSAHTPPGQTGAYTPEEEPLDASFTATTLVTGQFPPSSDPITVGAEMPPYSAPPVGNDPAGVPYSNGWYGGYTTGTSSSVTDSGVDGNSAMSMGPDGQFVSTWSVADSNNIEYRTMVQSTNPIGPVVSSIFLPDGARVQNDAEISSAVPYFVVNFDEEMMDPANNSGYSSTAPGMITNTSNWALVYDGNQVSGGISSVEFGMNEAQTLGLASIGSNTWQAVVWLNAAGTGTAATPLTSGDYQLVVKNSALDVYGNPLGRTGFAINGNNYTLGFNVQIPTSGGDTLVNNGAYPYNATNTQPLNPNNPQSPQQTASDGNGDYVVVWTAAGIDPATGNTVNQVLAKLYTVNATARASGGVPVITGTQTIIVSSNPNYAYSYASVAMNEAGDFIVTWAAENAVAVNGASSPIAPVAWDVYARRFDPNGNPLCDVFKVNTYTTGNQADPTVAMDVAGDFVVTWQSYGEDGSGYGIYAQRYTPSGATLGGIDALQTLTLNGQPLGQFSLTWNGQTTAPISIIAGENAYGVATAVQSALNQVNVTTTVTAISTTELTIEFTGASGDTPQLQLGVVNEKLTSGNSTSASVTVAISTAGSTGEFLVNNTTANNQKWPDIAMDASGEFVVTWTSYGQGGDGASVASVFARQFPSNTAFEQTTTNSLTVTNNNSLKTPASGTLYQPDVLENSATSPVNIVSTGTGYDGVVAVQAIEAGGVALGSGELLADGLHVLTAAHVLCDAAGNLIATSILIDFPNPAGGAAIEYTCTQAYILPGFNGNPLTNGHDLAIVTLPSQAPASAERYQIYTGSPVGQDFTFVGYGETGTGALGETAGTWGTERIGSNQWVADATVLGGAPDGLAFDFTDGTAATNAWAQAFNYPAAQDGVGAAGSNQGEGDSGGPCFINGEIAGVTDYGLTLAGAWNVHPGVVDGSYGEFSVDTNVSDYATWINSIISGGGSEFQVNQTTGQDRRWSSVAMDPGGDFVIAWTTYGQGNGGGAPGYGNGAYGLNSIEARRYSSSGAAASNEFQVNAVNATAGNAEWPRVSMDSAGDFTVAWEGNLNPRTGTNYDIYYQRFARTSEIGDAFLGADGAIGGAGQVNFTVTGNHQYPSVAEDDTGDYVVVWNGYGPGASQGIFSQWYTQPTDTAGPVVAAVNDVDTATSPTTYPEVLDNSVFASPVSQFIVSFSEPVGATGGPTGVNSVTNPLNWQISEGGTPIVNGIVSVQALPTTGQGTIPGQFEYLITFNSDPTSTTGPQPLGKGTYALTLASGVAGGAGVVDLSGNALDGAYSGLPGGIYTLDFNIMTTGGTAGVGGPIAPGAPGTTAIDIPVNTNSTLVQNAPAIATNGQGDYVVVWVIYGQGADATGTVDAANNPINYGDIVGQLFNQDGQKVGSQFTVNQITTGSQIQPAVAMDYFGDFVVTWSGYGTTDPTGIYARRFNQTGDPLGNQFMVNTYNDGTEVLPSVAVDANDDFVVSWTGFGPKPSNPATTVFGQWNQFYNSAGATVGGNYLVNVDSSNSTSDATSVAMNANGNFVMVWQAAGTGNKYGSTIFGEQFTYNGTTVAPAAAAFQISTYGYNNQIFPKVASDQNGDFVVTWSSFGEDGNVSAYGVYARRYNSAGVAQGGEFQVNQTTANSREYSSVAMDANGDFAIIWQSMEQDNAPTYDWGIYARMYNANGTNYELPGTSTPLGEFQINATVIGDQTNPVIAMDGEGDFDTAWVGPETTGSTGIYSRVTVLNPEDPFQPTGSTSSTGTNATIAPVLGSTTIGTYNPATSTFYLRNSSSSGYANETFNYGPAGGGWTPIVGDWTGQGYDTVGLYNPASSTFYLTNSDTAGYANVTFNYGAPGAGWIPLVGDWTGQVNPATGLPMDTIGLYDPTTSTFYLRNSNSAGYANITVLFGAAGAGWKPMVGDWVGNGITTVGIFNPAASVFYLDYTNTSGYASDTFNYGAPNAGWTPLSGDWMATGRDSIGFYLPAYAVYYLSNTNTAGYADETANYGVAGWVPLVGQWVPGQQQVVAGGAIVASAGLPSLTEGQLQPIVQAAIANWAAAGASSQVLAAMESVQIDIKSLPQGDLGLEYPGIIYIDPNAQGYGWYVDPTPADNSEFVATSVADQLQAVAPAAVDHIDLLTVLEHELGHVAGLDDIAASNDLMSTALGPGVRRLPSTLEAHEVDAVFAGVLD